MWDRDTQRAARALDRYLEGVPVNDIAEEFAISPATAHRWINARLSEINAICNEDSAARELHLQAAIEGQRLILREAWAAYHHECLLDEKLLNGAFTDEDGKRPHRPNHAVAFLRVALAAQDKIARLQGLYTRRQNASTSTSGAQGADHANQLSQLSQLSQTAHPADATPAEPSTSESDGDHASQRSKAAGRMDSHTPQAPAPNARPRAISQPCLSRRSRKKLARLPIARPHLNRPPAPTHSGLQRPQASSVA